MMHAKHAKVFGWGAVERKAAEWSAEPHIEEIEPRLWVVRGPDGTYVGVVGKDPWVPEEIQRRAEALAPAAEPRPGPEGILCCNASGTRGKPMKAPSDEDQVHPVGSHPCRDCGDWTEGTCSDCGSPTCPNCLQDGERCDFCYQAKFGQPKGAA